MRRRGRGGGEEKDRRERRKKIERMKKRETELSHRVERDEEKERDGNLRHQKRGYIQLGGSKFIWTSTIIRQLHSLPNRLRLRFNSHRHFQLEPSLKAAKEAPFQKNV